MLKWLALVVVSVCGWGFGALAQEEQQGGSPTKDATHEEKQDVATFIFHHVSDSHEFELEIPLNARGNNPVIHLPIIRIPLKEGACAAGEEERAKAALEFWAWVRSLTAGCLDISITKHVLMMWIAAVLLIILVLSSARRDRQALVPHGTSANLLEMMVLFVRDELAIKNIGKEEGPRYTPYLLTVFSFILFMNLIGLFPWMSTPTSNLGVTCGLAACTFVLTQIASIRSAGIVGYFKHLTGGVPPWLWVIMVPVEILGLFTKPFALTIRLFANMVAGHIAIFFLLGLIFILGHPAVAFGSVLFAMGIYFLELFVAFVQAYIFTILSALFIGMGVAMGHRDAAHAGEHEPVSDHQGSAHA